LDQTLRRWLLLVLTKITTFKKQNHQLKIYIIMNDNTKVVVALLAGLAAGAALGILFAPDKGTDTRDKLSESLKNLGDSIKETAAAEIDNLVGLKDRVVDSIKTKVRGAEEEYQDDLEHA